METKHWLALGFTLVALYVLYQVWNTNEYSLSLNSPMFTAPSKSKIVIVNYYATWCSASIGFVPTWDQFTEELRIKYPQIKTHDVVCEGTKEKQCAFDGITSYPTVIMYKGTKAIKFTGGRTILNLHKFVENNL
jgi:thiol-disulfide isomerase/thioredoxin